MLTIVHDGARAESILHLSRFDNHHGDERLEIAPYRLIENNNLPSESESQEAFELCSKSQQVLFQIDTEIQRLEEGVQICIDKCNAILSPARRLLPDMIREVLHHCLPTGRSPILATQAPMLLTQVCSYLAGNCPDIAPDLGQLTHWRSHSLITFLGVLR